MRPICAMMLALLAVGCGDGLHDGEALPGGAGTNTLLGGSNAFSMPAQNLSEEAELAFYSGNSFFNDAWVQAPASTDARDGLGPLFNARSCSGCHFRDGRGAPPDDGQAPFVGLLLRLSVPGPDGPEADPVYGGQLQDQGISDVPAEARPEIVWTEVPGSYPDGTAYVLLQPEYLLHDPAYGAFADDLLVSPRVAPAMIGLGLLEAIPESRLVELADPDDIDQDGISGRLQRHADGAPGRFGWKGDATTVADQVAGAFAGDMGLTSALVRVDDCTDAQEACADATSGGDPEVSDTILDRTVLYSRAIAVPARRDPASKEVRRGRDVFSEVGCDSCHVANHRTGTGALPAFEDQNIWPYTDLLLHDMGPGLADDRPVLGASGSEWKTPPLWGLGLYDAVSGHTRLLHDGRARSVEEAILWHEGEGEAAREAFMNLDADRRARLIRFVEDL